MNRSGTWQGRVAAVVLGLWGLLHVIGGASLLFFDGREGLETLAPDAPPPASGTSLEAAAAIVHFHGLNIALGGMAVLALAAWWAMRGQTWQLGVALAVAVALDIGLLAYLVAPGHLPASQGLLGPSLLGLGLLALAVPARRAHSIA